MRRKAHPTPTLTKARTSAPAMRSAMPLEDGSARCCGKTESVPAAIVHSRVFACHVAPEEAS
jgi:hypothetical protein